MKKEFSNSLKKRVMLVMESGKVGKRAGRERNVYVE